MKNDTTTEIDLWQLIVDGFDFIKKRKWLILSFLLTGTLFSLIKFKTNPLEYKSFYKKDFVVKSSIVSNEILSDIINNLSLKLNSANNNANKLASELGISVSTIREFKSIKGKLESVNNKDASRLKVSIEVYEKQNIDSVINGILFYINSIEYLKLRYSLMEKQHLQLLSILNKKIAESDSLKGKWDQATGNNGTIIINRNAEYVSYMQLLEKKQDIERDLTLNKIVDFIEINSPYIFVKNNSAAVLSILGYSFLGAIIGIILAFILNFFSKIKNRHA